MPTCLIQKRKAGEINDCYCRGIKPIRKNYKYYYVGGMNYGR